MAAVDTVPAFDSGHSDQVHDAQMDYYGKRIATCSSDRTVKVFDIVANQFSSSADLLGHEGPVWQVTWAHPKFGCLLASCSFDHRVIIWKEVQRGQWIQVYSSTVHTASVNSICFGPHELGLSLATASSDGSVAILSHQQDGTWATCKIDRAHALGAMAVSWAPATPPGCLLSAKPPSNPDRRLVSCGCDNMVRVWQLDAAAGHWVQQGPTLRGHSDWVRDVAWAPNMGLPRSTVASAGQDGRVLIWQEEAAGGWTSTVLPISDSPVWRVSWSVMGNILAVSTGTNSVTLWKEAVDGEWQQVAA